MQWPQVARRQAGIITLDQLRGCGLTPRVIASLQRTGQLRRRTWGVFIAGAAPETYEAALWSATLATGGILGFRTAANLWGMEDQTGRRIEVIIGVQARLRRLDGLRLHRVQLRPEDVSVRSGLPITGRSCSGLDHLGRLAAGPGLQFADRALQQSWFSRGDIERRLRLQSGRTGNVRLREILEQTADGAAARSERILHRLLRQGGITGWRANVTIRFANGSKVVVDVGIRALKIAIEVDGMAYHVTPDRFQADRTKQNRLCQLGWIVLRFTWADLNERPDYVIDVLHSAIVERN